MAQLGRLFVVAPMLLSSLLAFDGSPTLAQEEDPEFGELFAAPMHVRTFSPEENPQSAEVSGISTFVLELVNETTAVLMYREMLQQAEDDEGTETFNLLEDVPQFGDASIVYIGVHDGGRLSEDALYAEAGY